MDWLPEWEAFTRAADAGSMSVAARALGRSRAHVSKQIADLERALGARLFERTTRKLHLTPSGEVFRQHAGRVLATIAESEEALAGITATPRGVVRITAPVTFGRLHVAPILPAIAAAYPELSCELVLNDRVVDVLDEGFDIAVRLTDTPPQDLVARRLATIERSVCATPRYFARNGIPRIPSDLAKHRCFAYARARTVSEWSFVGPRGKETIAVRGPVQINHIESIMAAVLDGQGIAILPTYICGAELARGALVPVLQDHAPVTPFGRHAFACYPMSRAQLPKLRVVLSALAARFAPVPPWAQPRRRARKRRRQ